MPTEAETDEDSDDEGGIMNMLQNYLAQKLNLGNSESAPTPVS